MHGDVGLLASALLAAALAASTVAKVGYIEDTLAFFKELAPSKDPLIVAGAAVTGEALLVVLLLLAPTRGGAFAALWILLASAVLFRARRRLTSCGCFGRRTLIGAKIWVRNAGLALAGVVAWTAPPSAEATDLAAAAVVGVTVVVGREFLSLRGDGS